MPQAVPIIIAASISAGVAATAATATALSIASAFAGTLILGALSYALTAKPKNQGFSSSNYASEGSNVAVRQSDLTRCFVYGHTRVTKGYAHMQSTGVNGTLHLILILCEGPVRAINEIWVNDYAIPNDWIDSGGNVTQGRYAGAMKIYKYLGTPTQGASPEAMAAMGEWTSDHRLQGTAYVYIQLIKKQDIYPTGVPNFSAIVEGLSVYDPREETNVWTTNIALLANDFILNERYGLGALPQDIDDTNTSAQANICDEIVDVEAVDILIDTVVPGTDLITLDGDLLQHQFGDRVEILVNSGTIPGGLAVDTDYYVIPYQVKDTPRIGLAASLEDSLNKVYVDITSTGSGSFTLRKTGEPRYHGGGVFETDTVLSNTLNDLVSSMAGRAVCIGGFWTLLAGAWRSPTVTLGLDDIRGDSLNIKTTQSMSEAFNQVEGLFVSSVNYYQPTNYSAASYNQFINEDGGMVLKRDLNLPFTNRPTTAQRIAKIELFRARQEIAYFSRFSMAAMSLQPGDTVNLNLARYGWEPKIFEITDFSFDVNNGGLLIGLSLRETAEAIYDWSQGEAIYFDPAPNTSLPNPFDVIAPSGVSFNSRETETQAADILYTMQLQWDLHPDAFVVQYGDFEVQFKLSADVNWLPSFFVDGELMKTDVLTSSPGVLYDLRIRARNNLGVRSGWITIFNATVGSSGGVGTTEDWGSVADAPSTTEDWGSVADAPSTTEDWGYVA